MTTRRVEATAKRNIRISVLGHGFMGRCHSHAFKVIPYMYPEANLLPQLLILGGRSEEKVRREASRYDFEEYSTDWRDLVDDPRVDVFDNCAPDPLHPEPCIAALENGKHVICEKPLSVSVTEAQRMRDAARKSSAKALCVFNYRFFPAVRLARDLVAAGRLGKVYHMQVNYAQMAGHDPSVAADRVWYSSWPYSGVLQGIGCHAIDQCRFLVGEVIRVTARVCNFNSARSAPGASQSVPIDEASTAILEFEGGAIGTMAITALATGRKNVLSWEINGSEGSLRWNLEYPNSLLACLKGNGDGSLAGFTEISVTNPEHPYMSAWWPMGHALGWEHAHTIEKFHFLFAIGTATEMSPCLATFEDGYRASAIIAAIKESSLSGKCVAVKYQ